MAINLNSLRWIHSQNMSLVFLVGSKISDLEIPLVITIPGRFRELPLALNSANDVAGGSRKSIKSLLHCTIYGN